MLSDSFISLPWILLLGFLSSAVLTWVLMKLGLKNGVLDIPNERSSHSSPVPRGGGLAIVISFLAFLLSCLLVDKESLDVQIAMSLLVGSGVVAAIGVADDFQHVPAKWRFVIHISAALLSLILLPALPDIPIFGHQFSLGILGYAFFSIALVWYINLFNFMDGIDGIGAVEAITVLLSGMLIMFSRGDSNWVELPAYLSVCVAGFLVWNWPPAKVFMGDGCSGFLGLVLGLFAIVTSLHDSINLWAWLTLFGVFFVDATTTLVRRLAGGQVWYAAHRSHAYQILCRRYQSHRKVTLGVLILNVFWLLPLGFLAAEYPFWGFTICCFALAPLLVFAVKIGAGNSESELAFDTGS